MKAMYTLFAVAVVGLVGCKDDNKGLLDPNAMISIRPAQGVPSGKADAPNPKHLTAKEIVEKVKDVELTIYTGVRVKRYFPDHERDLVNNRFLMSATDAIESTGILNRGFLESSDWIFYTADKDFRPVDTVAYIPNSVMREVERKVKAAYAAGDYALCYQILDADVRFTPITGEEWRALKAKNEN